MGTRKPSSPHHGHQSRLPQAALRARPERRGSEKDGRNCSSLLVAGCGRQHSDSQSHPLRHRTHHRRFDCPPSSRGSHLQPSWGLPLRVMELPPPITELPPPAMAPLPTAMAAATSRSTSRALLIYSSRWPIFKGPPTTLLVKELRTQMESVTHHKRVP